MNDGGCDLPEEELKETLGHVSLNYIRLKENRGRAGAGNIGIENAKGEYIGFLDDDDEFYPEHVSLLVNFLEETDYKIAYSDSLMVFKEGFPAETNELINAKKGLAFSRDFDYNSLLFENYIPFMCLLFERDALINSDRFDNNFDLYEDWDLLIRIGERYPFCHVRKITSNYNQWSEESQISQGNKDFNLLKNSYIKNLMKHKDKITHNRLYNFISRYVESERFLKELKTTYENFRSDVERVDEFKSKLREKEILIKNLETGIRDRDNQIGVYKNSIKDKDDYISALKNTLGWRILERYRKVRNNIFLSSAEKPARDNFIVKAILILKYAGPRSLIRKINEKISFKKFYKTVNDKHAYKPLNISYALDDTVDNPIQEKVSVIIPTKNAGDGLDYTLRKINQQEGIRDIELIVIDSGSTDRTIEISRRYTQHVYQISPHDFHHAGTRNLGASKAVGEHLVFLVQDAIPVGNRCLYTLLNPVRSGTVSAVSTRQIPRSDADLFSCWGYWAHCRYLNYDHDNIRNKSLFKSLDELDPQAKRRMASLDTVCLGIRKNTFENYKFTSDYAEDLELGIRLIKDGHTLMFQSSNAVIHSHNRPAKYFFKRSYVDSLSLSDILNIERKNMPPELILETISYLYYKLKVCIYRLNINKSSGEFPDKLIQSVMKGLEDKVSFFEPGWQSLNGDALLDEYFKDVQPLCHQVIFSQMNSILCGTLLNFMEFLRSYNIGCASDDFLNSLYKFFCNAAGHYLGLNTRGRIESISEGI